MGAIIKGNPGALPQPTAYEFVEGQGWTTFYHWKGQKSAILGFASQIQANERGTIRATPDAPVWEALIGVGFLDDGSGEVPVNTYELVGDAISKSIRLNPYFESLTQAQFEAVDAKLRDESDGGTFTGKQLELYQYELKGQTSYYDAHYVFRHTQTASKNFAGAISVANVTRLWSTSQLLAANPDTPGHIVNALNAITPEEAVTGFLWSWLKDPPVLVKTILGKTEITEEWRLANWPTALYDSAA